jgi:CxxC-x17-CxxC domain-containing protein
MRTDFGDKIGKLCGKVMHWFISAGLVFIGACKKCFLQSQFKELRYRMFKYKAPYKVACSECGQEWQFSAKHDASKPIYCQECYWKRRQLGEFQTNK